MFLDRTGSSAVQGITPLMATRVHSRCATVSDLKSRTAVTIARVFSRLCHVTVQYSTE
jgi:hypothetical protein